MGDLKLIRAIDMNLEILCVMAKIEQNLEQIFENNFDCYAEFLDKTVRAMSKEKFIEIIGNLLTERIANKANSDNANRAIFVRCNTTFKILNL